MLVNNNNMFPTVKKTIAPTVLKIFPRSEYLLQFDGCSKGNPGLAGAGAVIYNYSNEIWGRSHFVGNKNTNNEAEYRGLIIGLEEALSMDIKHLTVEGDSLLVVKQMTGEYKVRSEKLLPLYEEASKLAKQFDSITFTHIYRENNKRADELSNIAVEMVLIN
jgi:ribonuclease HI